MPVGAPAENISILICVLLLLVLFLRVFVCRECIYNGDIGGTLISCIYYVDGVLLLGILIAVSRFFRTDFVIVNASLHLTAGVA